MKIFGWAADNAGPSWYRLRVPFDELSRQGYDATVDTTMPDWVLEEADVIVGQRVSQPGATERWRKLAAGKYPRRPLMVFEIDDDLWNIDPWNYPALAFYGSNPELLDNLIACVKLADVCTVSTPALADVVREFNPNVVIVPNQLPDSAYTSGHCKEPPHTDNPFLVGWAGGASHTRDVAEAVPGVRTFFKRHDNVAFHNIGSPFGMLRKAVGVRPFEQTRWLQDVPSYYRALDFHVGLAPLRPSVFNQSKSEVKFLEYAARRIPTVASHVGPYEWAILENEHGLFAHAPHEWCSALTTLRNDDALREELAENAFSYVRSRHIGLHWQRWSAVYRGEHVAH